MLTSHLANVRVAEVLPSEFYIHLMTPGTAHVSLDDLELVFPEDGGITKVRFIHAWFYHRLRFVCRRTASIQIWIRDGGWSSWGWVLGYHR